MFRACRMHNACLKAPPVEVAAVEGRASIIPGVGPLKDRDVRGPFPLRGLPQESPWLTANRLWLCRALFADAAVYGILTFLVEHISERGLAQFRPGYIQVRWDYPYWCQVC